MIYNINKDKEVATEAGIGSRGQPLEHPPPKKNCSQSFRFFFF